MGDLPLLSSGEASGGDSEVAASSDVSAFWRRSDGFTQQSISDLSFLPSSRGRPHSSSLDLPLLNLSSLLFRGSKWPREYFFLPHWLVFCTASCSLKGSLIWLNCCAPLKQRRRIHARVTSAHSLIYFLLFLFVYSAWNPSTFHSWMFRCL